MYGAVRMATGRLRVELSGNKIWYCWRWGSNTEPFGYTFQRYLSWPRWCVVVSVWYTVLGWTHSQSEWQGMVVVSVHQAKELFWLKVQRIWCVFALSSGVFFFKGKSLRLSAFYRSCRSVNYLTVSASEERKQWGHGCLSIESGADTGLFTHSKSPLSYPICQPVQTLGRLGLVQDLMTAWHSAYEPAAWRAASYSRTDLLLAWVNHFCSLDIV